MNRNSLNEMSARVMSQSVRLTLNEADDDPMMQEVSFDGLNSDGRDGAERVQSYGMTAVPLPRDPGGGGEVNGAEQPKGPAAEGIALFLGGQRNHPVVIAIDDRRHRPMGMQPGESAQYDDQGQMTLVRRYGLFLVSLDDGDAQRMVSLRHVQKGRQERPAVGMQRERLGPRPAEDRSERARRARNKAFKLEGEDASINTEVRCTKNRIEFRTGTKVVGYYDVAEDTWFFTGKVIQNVATSEIKDQAPKISHN